MINEETVNVEEMVFPPEGDASENSLNGENGTGPVSGDVSGNDLTGYMDDDRFEELPFADDEIPDMERGAFPEDVSGNTISDGNGLFSGEPASLSKFVLPLFAIAAIIAVALFVIRHRRGGRANGTANGAGSFPMTLTMIRGKCRSKADPVHFRDGMTVGSDPKCDLCMEGCGICPVHARIILVNGQLYIEDNNTEVGVTIGGMRIQDRNPLRPGDIVGLGDVYFSLRY